MASFSIYEYIVHNKLVATIELQRADQALAYERKCAEEATKSRQQVKDGIDLPEIVPLSPGDLKADYRLSKAAPVDFSAFAKVVAKALFYLPKEEVQP